LFINVPLITISFDDNSFTPHYGFSGFSIEFSSAITVLLSSKLGIPISSTHCIVGSIVFAGWAHGERDELENGVKTRAKVDWSLFRSIIYAWLVTIPAAGGASALTMAIFKLALL
jgi:sodium-dependent phosphate transporter